MVTLGHIDPTTGDKSVVEIGQYDAERDGYWAVKIDPDTHESLSEVFFAPVADLY